MPSANKRDKSPKRKDSMSAGWMFTLNNYAREDIRAIKALCAARVHKIVYLVFGKEVGEKGTPHLQGYVHFEGRKRMSTVRKMFVDHAHSAHLEPMMGTPEQASAYCKKDGDFWEFGELPEHEPGKRNDLLDIKHKIEGGATTDDIGRSDDHFGNFVRYNRGIREFEGALAGPRSHKSQVVVFFGDPGTFKSYSASRFKDSYEVVRPTGKNQPVWFDGYNPRMHTTVCFDDFYGWMPFHNLLQLCDRYQCRVQAKGHTKQFRPAFVTFTSNVHPSQWYKPGPGINYAALERRINFLAEHYRAEAKSDGRYDVGDILIRIHRGFPRCHPLYRFMKPIFNADENSFFKLDMPMLEEDVLDTDLDEEAMIGVYGTVMDERMTRPEAEPPLVADSQPDVTASQQAFIDLCESSYDGHSDDDHAAIDLDGASDEEDDSDNSGSDEMSA